MSELNIHQKLQGIQSSLKAPKGQVNKFGGYSYRSAEDILTALKPLLAEWQCTLVITDEIVEVGGRVYVKATAVLTGATGDNCIKQLQSNFQDSEFVVPAKQPVIRCDNCIQADGFAREAENKKGMDDAQITGSASSYARKYALNGLFAIDDTKDPDATNNHGKSKPKAVAADEDDLF